MSRQPSNPAAYFVSGNECAYFTYEPGKHPFYIFSRRPSDSGVGGYIRMSALVWADDAAHACSILRQMVAFAGECAARYMSDDERIASSTQYRLGVHKDIVDGLADGSTTITPFNPTQLVKVGWAHNDTF